AAAVRMVEKLQRLRFSEDGEEADLWRVAGILGREAELARGAEDLLSALAEALDPARAPRVSSLEEPSLYWNPAAHQWRGSPALSRRSEAVGSSPPEVGRLFAELAAALPPPGNPAQPQLAAGAASRRREIEARLRAALGTWADSWVVFEVPGHES